MGEQIALTGLIIFMPFFLIIDKTNASDHSAVTGWFIVTVTGLSLLAFFVGTIMAIWGY